MKFDYNKAFFQEIANEQKYTVNNEERVIRLSMIFIVHWAILTIRICLKRTSKRFLICLSWILKTQLLPILHTKSGK